jgi:hypothetical protein
LFHAGLGTAKETCTTNPVRVDYQRICEEAYKGRGDAQGGRRDRTTLVGAALLGVLVLSALFLPVVFLSDLSHQSVAQTLYGMIHEAELRFEGL